MALGEEALLTFVRLKDYFPDLSDDDQAFYEVMIDAASSTANRYAKRRLAARDYTAIIDVRESRYLTLPEYPINSVDSLFIDPAGVFPADSEITDFIIRSEEGTLYRLSGFRDAPSSAKIIYNAGYTDTPPDLEFAVVETLWWNKKRLELGSMGVKSIRSPDGLGTDFELTVPVNAQRVFEDYRRPE